MNRAAFYIQHACAVVLIVSSIVLVFIQEAHINDVSNGMLMYIAQAFLLAGSIFGLDYYVKKINYIINDTKRHQKQQSAQYPPQSQQ